MVMMEYNLIASRMKKTMIPLFGGLLAISCLVSGTPQNSQYARHKVLRIYPQSQTHVEQIRDITKRSNRQVRYWDDINEGHVPSKVDLISSHHGYNDLLQALRERQMVYDVMTHDLQQDLDNHALDNARARSSLPYFMSYHTLDEIEGFMRELIDRCDGRCSIINIGQSYEGRALNLMKITGAGHTDQKRKMWIGAGIHAREWISHATAQYLMKRLVEDYSTDPVVQEMVDKYEWYILPCVNPDGYNFTWETDRLWRKTRRPNPNTACVGTDGNRNFDFKWGVIGTTSDPCANNYQGPRPFSEPETRAIADFIGQYPGAWDMFLSLHSKGQLILAPWGYTYDIPEDYDDLEEFGLAMVDAIRATHGANYTFGSASSVLYRSSGTSRDWARGGPNIKYAYTIELRDRGQFGWVLPPRQILPTGEEIWAAIKAAMRVIRN